MSAGGLRIDVISIFPGLVEGFCAQSLLGRASREGLLDIRVHDPRDVTDDPHRTVDDAPFGGGAGMVMRPAPLFDSSSGQPPRPLFLLGPGGRPFDQGMARELAAGEGFSLLCGRYEGVDERVHTDLVDDELSIGDFVLSGGEVAALVVIEAVGRLVPGVMGNAGSADEESFGGSGLLEYPQYTRPAEFRGMAVPDVLRSGDHARVARWRHAQALARTMRAASRPDRTSRRPGRHEDRAVLEEFGSDSSVASAWSRTGRTATVRCRPGGDRAPRPVSIAGSSPLSSASRASGVPPATTPCCQ
jgi:tRNA (guanine37-N1)-methyltransferase